MYNIVCAHREVQLISVQKNGFGDHGNLTLVFEKSSGEVVFFPPSAPFGKNRVSLGRKPEGVEFTLFPFQTHLLSLDTCLRFYNSYHTDTASKLHKQNSYFTLLSLNNNNEHIVATAWKKPILPLSRTLQQEWKTHLGHHIVPSGVWTSFPFPFCIIFLWIGDAFKKYVFLYIR